MYILSILFTGLYHLLAIVGLLVILFVMVIKAKPALLLGLVSKMSRYKESIKSMGGNDAFLDKIDNVIEDELGDIPMFSKKNKK